MRPPGTPLGLQLALTAKLVSRAFNDVLAEAGGSIPMWLVLNSLKQERRRTQLELAQAIGIEGPTLTRHLDGLEESGLVVRHRDTGDRRAVRVELTEAGEQLHASLLKGVIAFNKRLTSGVGEPELERLNRTLARLADNVRMDE
jgi:MarR family transcriptional regulator, transcriptional regulator for hemolysin